MQGFQTIDPKFRSYYYKRLFSYYCLEIKTYFLNPINYLTMAALIVLGSIISLFVFVTFFNFATLGVEDSKTHLIVKTISSATNGKTITLFVTAFAAITGYRLFFVASTTLFNSSRLKQAYLYFHEKHVLRAQALREFCSSFLILFFYLLLLLFLLRVIPNSAGGSAAKYNFLTHIGGNKGLGAQFLFDFFAIIAISAIYTTFFITAQYFARLTKSRNSLNLVFAGAGVLFWFFFFLPSFFALAQIKHLGFMGHIPN